eukprot:scaffold2783_cov104-Skeletonema_dohrnii-CCMP3373.AAC.1
MISRQFQRDKEIAGDRGALSTAWCIEQLLTLSCAHSFELQKKGGTFSLLFAIKQHVDFITAGRRRLLDLWREVKMNTLIIVLPANERSRLC